MAKNNEEFIDEEIDEVMSPSDRIQPGDPFFTGPLVKSPDGDMKDKNISLITENFKQNIFVNAQHIRSYATTAEKIINNVNHFYNVYKEKRYENMLAEAAARLDSKLREYLLRTSVKSETTDLQNVSDIICDILDVFFKDAYLEDVARYVEKYSYYDDRTYDAAKKNYAASLDPTGIKMILMISVVLKQIWLLTKRTINATKISRNSIDIQLLNNKVTIRIFERAMGRCAYVYMNMYNTMWDSPADISTKFVSYFMDRCDKAITDNIGHINSKHAVLGTTEANITTSTYMTLCETVRKLTLVIGYKPGLIPDDDLELFMNKNFKQQVLTNDQYIYVEDLELFGFNISRVVKYIVSGLNSHVSFNGPRKKQQVAATIAAGPESDDDDSVSRRDRLLKKDDILNPEQKRINEQIKCALVEKLANKMNSSSDMMLVNAVKKVERNTLNMTILSMYIDYLGIYTGNPLSYMNNFDFGVTLVSVTKWKLLEAYPGIREALLSKKNDKIFLDIKDVNKIEKFINENFYDDINKDAIHTAIISITSSNYTMMHTLEEHSITAKAFTIPIDEVLKFFYDYKLHRDDENERF